MNKAIFIGELALNVKLCTDGRADTGVGDWGVNAAIIDGKMELPTYWMGEAAANPVGDHIVKVLEDAGIDCKSVDRFSEGVSPVRVLSNDNEGSCVDHSRYPQEPVSAIWPRIDEGDVVIYGSYMVIEERDHARVLEFLRNAKARKALLVYIPFFEKHQVPRITRVMPQIFDCLELADIVVGRDKDVKTIFTGSDDIAAIFKDHILFYCPKFINIDFDKLQLRFFDGESSWTRDCHPTTNTEFQWSSGALAGIVRALTEGQRDPDEIMNFANETAHSELASTIKHPCLR